MNRRYYNQAGADGAEGGGAGGSGSGQNNGNNNGGANGGGTGGALHRPDYIPESFWDTEKGSVKLEDFGKNYATLQSELTTLKSKQVQVPEKYDLKLPEGALLKAETVERAASTAKKLGLPQEGASEVLTFVDAEVKAYRESLEAEHTVRVDKWLTDSKADKEISGETGDQFDANVELARRAFKQFGGDELVKVMNDTGYGNHPLLVKTFMRIGKAMADDKLEMGNHGGSGGPKTHAQVLYGGQGN